MKRVVLKFSFDAAEQQHAENLVWKEHILVALIARKLEHTYRRFDLIGPLPTFAKRDRKTLLAGLVSRTFSSVNCAMNLAVRGYHVQSIMLIRSTLEDDWLNYEL